MERIEIPNMVEPLRANRYTIETLDAIGVVISTLEMEVSEPNVEIGGDYSDDNLMLTKFRFIITPNTMKIIYAN